MSTTLSYSTFENLENNDSKPERRRKNRTIKKKSTKKVETFLNGIEALASMDEGDDDSGNLADFNEGFPPQPKLTRTPQDKKDNFSAVDAAVSPEGFSKMNTDDAANINYQNYFKSYVPYYSTSTNNANLHGSKDELMKKLNYMIHLLEETKEEKTSNVTEELVLYMFLGVFVIFVVDSFARAGKYTR